MASDILCLCAADLGLSLNASEILLRCSSDMGPMRLPLFHALFPFNDSDNLFRCSSDMGFRLRTGIEVRTPGFSFCRRLFLGTYAISKRILLSKSLLRYT